jgi:hypothetical protein
MLNFIYLDLRERGKVTEEWRKLHKELHNLYPPNIIRVIKSNTRSMAPVAYIGDTKTAYIDLNLKTSKEEVTLENYSGAAT